MIDLFVYEAPLHEKDANREWSRLLGRDWERVEPKVGSGLSWRLADGSAVTGGIVFAHQSDLSNAAMQTLLAQGSESPLLVVLFSQGQRDGTPLGNGMVYQLGRSVPYPPALAQRVEYKSTVRGFQQSVEDFCIDWETTGIPDFALLESGERRAGLTERHLWHELKNARDDLALSALVQMGQRDLVARYIALYESGAVEDARQLAGRAMHEAAVSDTSSVESHRSLSFSPMAVPVTKREPVKILMIEDQKYWFDALEARAEYFAREYGRKLEVAWCSDRASAAKKLKGRAKLHAIVIDYVLEPQSDGPQEASVHLAGEARRSRKGCAVFGLTGRHVREVSPRWNVDRVFFKDDAAEIHELLLAIAAHANAQAAVTEVDTLPQPRKKVSVLVVGRNGVPREGLIARFDAFNGGKNAWLEIQLRNCPDQVQAVSDLHSIRGLVAVIVDAAFGAKASDQSATSELFRKIRGLRPELPLFGLADGNSRGESKAWGADAVFTADDITGLDDLVGVIVQSVTRRSATPFFSALAGYARQPVAVFHALPISRAKSIANSQWAKPFAQFYGEGYFAAESSSTLAPLDSIFGPQRTLREAQSEAAKAFGSDETYFVTNGTTGANSIVYQAVLRPGDQVVLDRNCHKSHHYASVQVGAHVFYLEPEHIDRYGISSLVPTQTIVDAVRRLHARNPEQPRMMALTHPTFDGLLYDPVQIIEQVYQIHPDIVFLFDEAWFAYGAFHPRFRARTAMHAARMLRERGIHARVFVTQSIHKTLSAMRQGSAIHVAYPATADQTVTEKLMFAMDESLISHTTTSPNLHILGSLDVARMQARMEGFDRLEQALALARYVRSELAGIDGVKALCHGDLTSNPAAMLDPLKLTLKVDGVSGAQFRRKLDADYRIQINKYSHNTFLALITIGTTPSMARHLVDSLRRWSDSRRGIGAVVSEGAIPKFSEFNERFRDGETGVLASAYYAGLHGNVQRVPLSQAAGKTSACFVSPYPPGYPILVPGQIITDSSVAYIEWLRDAMMMELKDIHGVTKDGLAVI